MNTAVVVIAGAMIPAGLFLTVVGCVGVQTVQRESPRRTMSADTKTRLGLAAVVGVGMWVATGWVTAGVFGALAGGYGPTLMGAKAARDRRIARTEALAGWVEQLRDTMAAASGLREAITVTAKTAPPAIRGEVAGLARQVARHRSLEQPLRAFAATFDDSVADSVIAALVMAETAQAGRIVDVLSSAAVMAREKAAMRLRVEASRAATYSSARWVVGITLVFAALLMVIAGDYLAVYDTGVGQLVLAVIGSIFGFGEVVKIFV